MGVMLVAGVVALVAVVAVRLSYRVPAAFSAPAIELPKGAEIDSVSTGPDRIVLHLSLADGTRQLVIIDLATGRQVGVIPLRESP